MEMSCQSKKHENDLKSIQASKPIRHCTQDLEARYSSTLRLMNILPQEFEYVLSFRRTRP